MYFSDAPYFGGAEKYLELLISALRRDRYEPSVVARKGADLGGFVERLGEIGVQLFETTLSGPWDIGGYWDFFRIVKKWRPDILHINLPGTYDAQAGLVAPVARAAGCSFVVTTEHLAMVETLWKRRIAKKLSALWIQRVVSITNSNVHFLTDVHGIPASKIEVIHNGIDLAGLDGSQSSGLRAGLGMEDSVFLFAIVGSLIERKGHRTLLDAFARVTVAGGGPAALVVVGGGPEESSLKRRIRQLGLDKRVFFLGHRENVQGIMREIDCLVVPSVMEGMPFVILEAMAASKPVIASEIYGIPEVIVEDVTGLLVPPARAEQLSAAMLKVMDSPELARKMGVGGRERVKERFTREVTARRVEGVYETLLNPDRVRPEDGTS
jgi:glycosyltransferase involved in cell wall biosynthesis